LRVFVERHCATLTEFFWIFHIKFIFKLTFSY
jgi:hypothetical protein